MSDLKENQVLIYPTDTVWGIGGCILSERNYLEVNKIKQTSNKKPVSILFSCIEDVREYFSFPEEVSNEWMESFFRMETTLGLPLAWAKRNTVMDFSR